MEKTKAGPRLFTRGEAQKMLPLVRVIVQDIVDHYRTFRDRVESYRTAAGAQPGGPGRTAGKVAQEAIEEEIERLKDKVNDAVEELGDLGVEFKDFETGLVDFPAKRGDDVVYLCWKLGEDRIGHWHTLEGGFKTRQALDDGALL